MVVKLMNSAMMPAEGVYKLKKITPEEAKEVASKATVESYVGYPDTAKYMSEKLGIEVPVNRSEAILEDGDVMIICKLKYRVQNPQEKGKFTPNDDDFEWYICYYNQ